MKCSNCKDERIVWERDEFGFAVCSPCKFCNDGGAVVRKEQQAELERLRKEWSTYGNKQSNGVKQARE